MKRVCLRSIVGCCAGLILVATGQATTMVAPPAIVQYVGADFSQSGNPTGAFKIVNLGLDPINSATIDLSPIVDSTNHPSQAFEITNGTANPVSFNAAGSHGIDATALSPQPTLAGTIGGSSTLFPTLDLNFKSNSFGPGATFAFDIPVVKVDSSGTILSSQETGKDLAGGLVTVNTPTAIDSGTLFVPPATATSDNNASVALLTPSGLNQSGEGGVPEPASLLIWSLVGLGGLGIRRKLRVAA